MLAIIVDINHFSVLQAICIANNNLCKLRDKLITMLIAGHETTATTFMWTTYYLAQVNHSLGLTGGERCNSNSIQEYYV